MYVPLKILFVWSICICSSIADRRLHAEFNPGCLNADRCSAVSKLAYIRSEGENDTVHFLFDFTSKPTLVVVTTAKEAVIQVNYTEGVVENSIQFTKTPFYTFATTFNNLYDFNDINDTASLENEQNLVAMDFKNFNMNMDRLQNYNNNSVEVILSSNLYRAPGIKTSCNVSIVLKVFGNKGAGSKLPHLIHTPESGELTLTLDGIKTSFNNSRFAVELLTLSSFPFNESEELGVNSFSDDKLSGGTFLNYLIVAKRDSKEGGGYLSWKPVVFKANETHALNSSSSVQYDIRDHFIEKDWINTPLYKLYGNTLFDDMPYFLKKATNVSFGQPNDGFYKKSNYLYWTFMVGVGAPPNSSLGFLEMSIIASLILLLSITMILIFCLFMRWVSSKRNSIIYGQ